MSQYDRSGNRRRFETRQRISPAHRAHWGIVLAALLACCLQAHCVAAGPNDEDPQLTDEPLLIQTIQEGDLQRIADVLRDPAAVKQVSVFSGWTGLHWAAKLDRSDVARLLIDAGADVNARDRSQRTPLHLAAIRGSLDVTKMLQQHQADISLADELGYTALHHAVRFDHRAIVERLLEQDADVNVKNRAGITPMIIAQRKENVGLVELLKRHGALETAVKWEPVPELPRVDVNAFTPQPVPGAELAIGGLTEEQLAMGWEGIRAGLVPPDTPPPTIAPPPDNVDVEPMASTLWSSLGLTLANVPSVPRTSHGSRRGAVVADVKPRSIASRIRLQKDDVISMGANQEVVDVNHLHKLMREQVQKNSRSFSIGVDRGSEGVSYRTFLPLPLFDQHYESPDKSYRFRIPDGWFLIPKLRNLKVDEGFDSLISTDGKQVLIIARAGIRLEDPQTGLEEYRREKLAEAQNNTDLSSEPFEFGTRKGFRISYRSPQQRLAVSRVSFVESGRRYVINAVFYDTDSTQLTNEVRSILECLTFLAPSPPRTMFGRQTRPPLIGIWTVSAGTHDAHALGIETPLGAVVKEVQRNSPAARAGFRVADVVVASGNREITNYEDLEVAMLSCATGSRQEVTIVRGLSRRTLVLTIGAGPEDRQIYADYKHPSGGYALRLPVSWKVVRSSISSEQDVNAHDLLTSRDGNYRLHCYLISKPAGDVDRALGDFVQNCRRDLGNDAQIGRLHGLPVPLAFAALPYQADRRVMLYRVAFVKNNRFYLIDALAPVLSNPATLTDVLKTILETV